MQAFSFEAVVYDCEVYCEDCLPDGVDVNGDDVSPIFADSTWDTPPVCTMCGAEHDYMNVLSTNEEYLGDSDAEIA